MSTHRIRTLWWIDTRDMLADGLNKGAVSRKALLEALTCGRWRVNHPRFKRDSNKIRIKEFEDDEDIHAEALSGLDHYVRVLLCECKHD